MARVLVVEDEPTIRSVLVEILNDARHQVIEARNGAEAVRCAREQHPDVVVMDLLLPIIDGAAATEILKEDQQTAGIPVIAMSATLDRGVTPVDLPVEAVLAKPFDIDALLRTIDAAVTRGAR
jgi:CheY-like chemotaxis protein